MEHDKRILTPLIIGEYTAKVNAFFRAFAGHFSRQFRFVPFLRKLVRSFRNGFSNRMYDTRVVGNSGPKVVTYRAPSRYRLFHLSSRA